MEHFYDFSTMIHSGGYKTNSRLSLQPLASYTLIRNTAPLLPPALFSDSIYRIVTIYLEKEMETHFSILSWRIPWTEEPGGLQSMGPQRARQD